MYTFTNAAKRVLGLALIALFAAACSGSGAAVQDKQAAVAADPMTGTATPSPSQTPEPRLTKRDFKVGVIGFGTDAAILAASEQGFFEAEGLDVELELTRSGSPMIAAVSGGSLDFGIAGISPPLHAISQETPIKVIANLVLSHDLSLQIHKEAAEQAGIPLEGASLEEQVAAMAGSDLSIGVGGPGGGVHVQTAAVLENHGVDVEKDVSIEHYETPDSLVTAFQQSDIDAYAWISPHSLAVPDDEVLRLMLGDLPEFAGSVQWPVTTRTSLLEDHPESVDAFMRAVLRGWLFMRDDPDELGKSFRERFVPEMDQEVWERMWSRMVANVGDSPAVTREGLDKAIAITEAGAPAPLGLDFGDVVDNTFINRAIEAVAPELPTVE